MASHTGEDTKVTSLQGDVTQGHAGQHPHTHRAGPGEDCPPRVMRTGNVPKHRWWKQRSIALWTSLSEP